MFDLGITENQEFERQKQENEKEEEDETSNCHCTIQRSQEKKILLNVHII